MPNHFKEATPEQLKEYQARSVEVRRERHRVRCAFAREIFKERHNIRDVMERMAVSQSAAYRMIDKGKE